jgi:serine/threonine protein phosphatase PrpC
MKLLHPYSLINTNKKTPEFFNFNEGTLGIYSTASPDEENRLNQDSCALIPIGSNKVLLIVADGVGGCRGGDMASRIAVEKMIEQFEKTEYPASELPGKIINGFEVANKAIRDLGIGAGTTLVCSEINQDYVRFYNTGDSIAQLLGGKGVLKYRTLEQNASGYAIESQMVKENDAQSHKDSNMLLACLGDPVLRLEVSSQIAISSRDLVLVASDGLWANVSQEMIQQSITTGTIEDRLNRLIELSHSRMNHKNGNADDLTLLIYSFGRIDNHS